MRFFTLWLVGLITLGACAQKSNPGEVKLSNNWSIALSAKVEDAQTISKKGILSDSWTKTTVPNTVMGSLVSAGVYKDIYEGQNMANIDSEQFKTSWIYYNNFSYDKVKGEFVDLKLDGINYRANVWLNGKLVADSSEIFGVYKQYRFDITDKLKSSNQLAIEVFPPIPGDFTIGFVDWAPVPPDNNMGIWREVSLVKSESVLMKETFVYGDFDVKNPVVADLYLSTVLENKSNKPVDVQLNGKFGDIAFTTSVSLKENEQREFKFDSEDIKELSVKNPKLWWPHNYGEPNMYILTLTAQVDSKTSSSQSVDFGIRKVEDYINAEGHRGYKINGQEILIKGGGWVDELLLNNTVGYDEAQVLYTKEMKLNTIRFEGFWGKNEEIYKLCDKHGLLAMVGFSCQWEWSDYLGGKKFNENEDGFGGVLEKDEIALVANYFEDQVKWLRNHPSIFVYSVGSDRLPHPDLELLERDVLKKYDPSRPMLTAAKYMVSQHSGPSAVKMEGPYDYVTPNYWYTDTVRGGAFGFNTETGPGPQPPVLYSVNKMIPNKANQWPLDNDTWKYHSGRHAFGDMSRYLKAFDARYGKSENVKDFSKFAQVASYEAMRPMYESFAVNRPNTTGIIQWMLNSAWPETFWQLYDSYLHPTGAQYGAMHGARDINVVYNYGDARIYVSNESLEAFDGTVVLSVLDTTSKVVYNDTISTSKFQGSKMVLDLNSKIDTAQLKGYFVDLTLYDINNNEIADNFYWLSSKPDVVDPDYSHSSWIYTPNVAFGDLKFVRNLPQASLTKESGVFVQDGDYMLKTITLKNDSDKISFFNEFTVVDETDAPVLPVFWSDNYVSVLPGESKELTVRVNVKDAQGKTLKVVSNTINTEIK